MLNGCYRQAMFSSPSVGKQKLRGGGGVDGTLETRRINMSLEIHASHE